MIDCSGVRIYVQNSCYVAQVVDKVGKVIKVVIRVVVINCGLTYVATPGDNVEVIDFAKVTSVMDVVKDCLIYALGVVIPASSTESVLNVTSIVSSLSNDSSHNGFLSPHRGRSLVS